MSGVQEEQNPGNNLMSEEESDDDVEIMDSMAEDATVQSASGGPNGKCKSIVWDFFELRMVKGELKGVCKECHKDYKYDSQKTGTSSMKRHKCPKRENRDVKQMLLAQNDGLLCTRARKIDQTKYREYLSMLIIQHGLPLSFVEYPAFQNLISYCNPDVKHITRNTEKADVNKIHSHGKDVMRKRLQLAPGRVCLTSDMWTSVTTTGFISLTVHYVDHNWELQKQLLNYCPLPPPHTGEVLAAKLFSMIEDWGIQNKVSNITLDNAANNGACARLMRVTLKAKNLLPQDGKYFHVRCCAHILALGVKEGITMIDPAVIKIRESVKFLKSSQVRKEKFLEIVRTLGMSGIKRGIRQDVKTRWNSTYLMLDSCLVYKKVFTHLKEVDDDYKDSPTDEQWKKIKDVTRFLKTFYDLTTKFSGSKYPTSNLYFEGVCQIKLLLKKEGRSENEFIRNMVQKMLEKFDSYWKELSPILALAVVLDPRLKLTFVHFNYKMLYDGDTRKIDRKVNDVRNNIKALFDEYCTTMSRASTSDNGTQNLQTGGTSSAHQGSSSEIMQAFAAELSSGGRMQLDVSELDQYLSELSCSLTQSFDILKYWKGQEQRFPVLSRMAGDILSIPISTVASESAFSIGGKVISRFRSSLLPENAEALIVTRDWDLKVGKEDWDEDNGIIHEDVLGFELDDDKAAPADGEASSYTSSNLLVGM